MKSDALDLRKKIVLDLKKDMGINGLVAQVVLVLDFSGSMRSLYEYGFVQEVVERILPLGLGFDDDGQVQVRLFNSGEKTLPVMLTKENYKGYVSREILNGKHDYSGTSYAPVIDSIVKEYAAKGFLGSKKPMKDPVYVIFITDGENSDRFDARKAIISASNHAIFFQFVGIGEESFKFLKELDTMDGRNVDNANFFQTKNIGSLSDEQLYRLLMAEFPKFVGESKSKSMLI